MLTRSASYPDRETVQWATQQVVAANEQAIHRWLAQNTRARLTVEAAWTSREEPVGRVQLEAFSIIPTETARLVAQFCEPVVPALAGEVEDVPHRAEQVDAALVDVVGHPGCAE